MISSSLGIIVQARTGSKRFKNKILKPLGSYRTVLEYLLSRLNNCNCSVPIVVATTNSENDNVIEDICLNNNVSVFRGDEDNVLVRFIGCANKYNFRKVIRVCSDNPFIDLKSIRQLVNEISSSDNFDYISFMVNGRPAILSHYGFWAEAVTVPALEIIRKNTHNPIFLEHVQ